jgi:predicted lysophospholipase L1 biosynthesis ABC-type transport system permease subunit
LIAGSSSSHDIGQRLRTGEREAVTATPGPSAGIKIGDTVQYVGKARSVLCRVDALRCVTQ